MPRHRAWSAEEDRDLRALYGKVPVVDVADFMTCFHERSLAAVKSRAKKLGIGTRVFWTDVDDAYLRDHYRRQPVPALAAKLQRTLRAVWMRARTLGLATPTHRFTAADQQRLRDLVAQRLCNRCISRELGFGRKEIRHWRTKLGLPPVGCRGTSGECQRCVAAVRAKTQEQCRKAGVASLAEVRRLAFDRYARQHGWPEDLRPRAVQILELLYHHGPQTRRQIAAAIGLPWRGSRKSLCSNDAEGSYLAHLQALGLVIVIGRVAGKGRGSSHRIYSLTLEAAEHREHFAETTQTTGPHATPVRGQRVDGAAAPVSV